MKHYAVSALVLLATGLPVWAGATAVKADFFVSPAGNDAWSGKLPSPNKKRTDGPFATLSRARDEIRKQKADQRRALAGAGLPGGATVLVRAGTYFLKEPLTFGPEDSGTEKGPITYAAYPGEKVTVRGSRPVTGWKRYRGGIYQADLTGFDTGVGRFWQLFYKAKRQVLARYPNVDSQHPRTGGFLYISGVVEKGSKTLLQYNPKRLDPSRWPKPTEVRVHVWPWLNWNRNISPIKAVDTDKHVLTLALPASYMLIEGNRFFVENALEELDAPGEWYYDEATKQLYFWPPDNQNPEGQVSIPALSVLLQIHGDADKKEFVQHLHLRHFTLAESRASLITLSMASYSTIAGCTLTHCGGTALSVSGRSHHNRVVGCDIAHVGGCAVSLDEVVDWSHSLDDRISFNLISNNHIHDVGEEGNAWGALMINPGCGGNVTHDNVISHNLIHDTPRQGITFNGFRNIVEYNHVHHTNQEQSDTGAIGMGSRDIDERGSIIRYNYVHDTGGYNMLKPGVWEYPHYCWGIYLDDYTSGVHVYGNIAVRTYLGGVMVHGGQDNIIENNIIVDGLAQQVQYAPIDSTTSGRNQLHPRNKEMWLMTGTKLLGNIFCYSGEKSAWVSGSKWEQILAESDRNLIWHHGKPVTINLPGVADGDYWAAWQRLGFDKHSVIADPQFVDPKRDDYRLRPTSPAFKLGFKPIPVEKIGLYPSPDRASWPVPDQPWREQHLTHPEGEVTPAPTARKQVPTLKAVRVSAPSKIDGKAEAPEWNWDAPGAKVTVAALSLEAGIGKQPSYAMVMADESALYVALINRVSNSGKLLTGGGVWGQDDGAEICIQDVSGQKPGPVFVVQGYPSGKCESVDHADAPATSVRRLGQSVQYAATIGEGQWVGEWKIPFSGLGIDPQKTSKLLFNIGVLKAAEKEWIAWVSTGAAPWRMELAGQLVMGP